MLPTIKTETRYLLIKKAVNQCVPMLTEKTAETDQKNIIIVKKSPPSTLHHWQVSPLLSLIVIVKFLKMFIILSYTYFSKENL